MLKAFRILIILYALGTSSILGAKAQEHQTAGTEPAIEKFNASRLIMEHIADSYEWHIAKFGETHVSIPLPVILYSPQSGFHFFISNKFHHGTESYSGFRIAGEESKYKGKVVELGRVG